MTRCKWCNTNNALYIKYHDEEWACPVYDDAKLYELLLLEPFQAGLSWETVLNKRDGFRAAFDNFTPALIKEYDAEKIDSLMANPAIIRNRKKIEAAINNAKVFECIQNQWGSFSNYIWHFTNGKIIYEVGLDRSPLSDWISTDLKNLGMKFIGTTTVYAFLQAIGIIYSHDIECFLYKAPEDFL